MVEDFRQDDNRCRASSARVRPPRRSRRSGRPRIRPRAPALNCTRPTGSLRSKPARTLTWQERTNHQISQQVDR